MRIIHKIFLNALFPSEKVNLSLYQELITLLLLRIYISGGVHNL